MDIKLNFINLSNDMTHSHIVIFQKNLAGGFDDDAVAWKVIDNCGPGDNHPFTFPRAMTVATSDSAGNFSPQLTAENGQIYDYGRSASGSALTCAGPGAGADEVHVLNKLHNGAINARIFKGGKLLATRRAILAGQKAVFQFDPAIWIGAVSPLTQGSPMPSSLVSGVNTTLSLLGLKSADIVMTGGGAGRSPPPITFTLCNKQTA